MYRPGEEGKPISAASHEIVGLADSATEIRSYEWVGMRSLFWKGTNLGSSLYKT
jgi:hypothetical protein